MAGIYGEYTNYTEWKRKDPEGYWAMINGRLEKMKPVIDEEFARRIAAIPVGEEDEWSETINRAIRGELTDEEIAISNSYPGSITVPLEKSQKWYTRFWRWVKSIFGPKAKTIEDFKMKTTPISKILRVPIVEMNKEFDFQGWVAEKSEEIKKAIRADGKEDGEVKCPVCFKTRTYAIVSNGHIKTTCKGCSIELIQ